MKKRSRQTLSAYAADNIHVITINQRRFVTGLTWQTIKAQRHPMKEIRRVGKAKGLDLVAVRTSESSIQAGFAPKTRLRLRGSYSLTVALASLLEGCCIAVISLGDSPTGEQQFTLVGKTERGGIHVRSDKVFSADELRQTIIDLREELRGSKGELNVPVYGDLAIPEVTDELDLNVVLAPKNLNKAFRLKPLTMGMTREQLIATGTAAALGLCGIMWWQHVVNEREAAQRVALQKEMLRQEKLNKEARYKAALESFRHPWTEQTSVNNFIEQCQSTLSKIPISINGWMSTVVVCTARDVTVQSIRRTNSAATTLGYVEAVRKLFSVTPVFSFEDSSQITFSLPHTLHPEGDDPLIAVDERLIKLISRFQALNVDLAVNPIPIKDIKQNSEGETLPLQQWQEYQFSAETDVPPRDIFSEDNFTGIRLSEITLAVNTSDGSVRYKISGSLYGKRKN